MKSNNTSRQIIQAPEIRRGLYQGVPDNLPVTGKGYDVIIISTSGDVTFTFTGGDTKTINLPVGGFSLSDDITHITSALTVILS
jgi:hypothetical protein